MILDPIKLTQKLVKIESVSGNEKEIGEFIHDYLKSAGMKPKFQKVTKNTSNVIVKGKSDIQVNGHMDTVPLGEGWRYKQGQLVGNKLYGRGACDIKGSIAVVLAAAAKFPSEVNLSFVVEEENTFRGVKKLKTKKYVIELEPTENRIVYCHKGQIRFRVIARGKAAHASVPDKGDNAIIKLSHAISKLEKHRLNKRHRVVGKATQNIGTIEGGTTSNTVPAFAEMHIDRRTLPNENIQKIVQQYKKMFKPLKTEATGIFNAKETDKNSSIIKQFQKILKKHRMNTKLTGVQFTTQLGAMRNAQGFVFGPGSVNQAHQIDEFVKINEIKKAHSVFCDLFKQLR